MPHTPHDDAVFAPGDERVREVAGGERRCHQRAETSPSDLRVLSESGEVLGVVAHYARDDVEDLFQLGCVHGPDLYLVQPRPLLRDPVLHRPLLSRRYRTTLPRSLPPGISADHPHHPHSSPTVGL
jgi:hypothetical protein